MYVIEWSVLEQVGTCWSMLSALRRDQIYKMASRAILHDQLTNHSRVFPSHLIVISQFL